MHKKVIAGNWKMNNDLSESQNLITRLTSGLSNLKINCDIIICPPFTSLSEANTLIKNTAVTLGAQNVTEDVIKKQVMEGLQDISEKDISNMIIAYEPVWAIGTGRNATPQQAQDVHSFIRKLIEDKYSSSTADNLTIQYGGSVKPDNAKELLSQPDIDGALVGGACLKVESFIE